MRNLPKIDSVKAINPIFNLVRSGNLAAVKEYIDQNGPDVVNQFDSDGYSLMHWAAYDQSCVDIVLYLIDELHLDFDDSSNAAKQRPIHWACMKGYIEIVKILLDHGVDINVQDTRGYSPLISACQYGHVPLVAYLVSRNARLDISDTNGDNSLQWAVYKGYPDLTRLLIVYGMSPRKIDSYNQTLLHLACLSGNLNIVQQLIEQDCIDLEIRDNKGRTALDLAKTRGYSEIVDYLERHSRNRRKTCCNYKTFLFGPVGNSKLVFVIIQAIFLLYEYPSYLLKVVPETWDDHFELHIAFLINSVIMWVLLYAVHWTDPGYIRQNTNEYQSELRKITFKSQGCALNEWKKNLTRLCHTCKAIKPMRASHCRACNRCVVAFDHHCPYVQNCIGYRNRPYFCGFVVSMFSLQLISARIMYIVLSKSWDQYFYYFPAFLCGFFLLMTCILTVQSCYSALSNYTSNELMKKKKYDYLMDAHGNTKNLFSRGIFYNIKYYFHLVEPSHLEVETTEIQKYYV